jgi:hypothetical protein
VAQKVGEELGLCPVLLDVVQGPERGSVMASLSLATSVFMSKAEVLALLADTLGVPWILDDPADVTLALPEGVVLSIEVPKFGEDLPLTLDLRHTDAEVLTRVAGDCALRLDSELGWATSALPIRD